MSMHLVGPYLTTNGKTKRKPSKSKKLAEANAKHEQWLKDRGLHKSQRNLQRAYRGEWRDQIPSYSTDMSMLSNTVGNGYRQGIMENLHKESPEVQKAILEKASRTTVAYNKGPVMYFSPDSDTSNLGSQSRRG